MLDALDIPHKEQALRCTHNSVLSKITGELPNEKFATLYSILGTFIILYFHMMLVTQSMQTLVKIHPSLPTPYISTKISLLRFFFFFLFICVIHFKESGTLIKATIERIGYFFCYKRTLPIFAPLKKWRKINTLIKRLSVFSV